ncbi:sigma-54-dependent Fis family transcriptional regulator [Ramlibacter ginsenosidimutans]|uniref:Sigma-54-dependent Fis family transcriptional regulator n=1 Tax=Ramlibacter ginsenosidimutans TaxID=502333 RepID=A0A934TRZ0_9BURK|nr:sigma-54 dependent transcriptional regulator [Ramlibacter ginsenosidimutans]MBK6006402.1 sigma-54-dependent Fis family transcriptional regulator [Ramlibacter ginsenosidimutans]
MNEQRPILVVAAEDCRAELLEQLLARGWLATTASNLAAAAALLHSQRFPVALLLLDSSHPDAAAQFQTCAAMGSQCEWVGVFPAGECTRAPWRDLILTYFFDHHTYPADLTFLCQSLGHAWGRASLREGATGDSAPGGDMGMVGESPALRRLRSEIRKAGPSDAPVLIAGESGSGKELVARALHLGSRRAKAPFVPVNCGALPTTLIQSELFGHERGAFTGASSARRGLIEEASGGTLLLDEIAELPLETQATLLRFLQERRIVRVGSTHEIQVDTRVIAASHVDLESAVAVGRFRADLFFRLNVLHLRVPPLRERREDIPRLARHVYAQTAAGQRVIARGFHPDAIAAMMEWPWPGNVRELCNRVQRAVVMADRPLISADDLGLTTVQLGTAGDLEEARVEAEKCAIRDSLARERHNVTLAARDLGVSRMTLYRLMAKHSITPHAA